MGIKSEKTDIDNKLNFSGLTLASGPDTPVSNEEPNFIDILHNSKLSDFLSFRYNDYPSQPDINTSEITYPGFLPSVPEAIVHLKLLKAFSVLKRKVIGSNNLIPNEYDVKKWQIYITDASRRFIIFMSSIRSKFGTIESEDEKDIYDNGNTKNEKFISMMKELMPPLDVIMVWHSFLLNPKSMYDVCIRNKIYQFANYPLPLHIIDQFIDDYTFEFHVPQSYKQNYLDLLRSFTNDPVDLLYDNSRIAMNEHLVTLYCPKCHDPMTKPIPITNDENTGFCDADFQTINIGYENVKCYHGTPSHFTHDELRKLQLYCDMTNLKSLQGTHKYFSKVICPPKFTKRNPFLISDDVCKTLEKHWDTDKSLDDILKSLNAKHRRELVRQRILLRNYLQYNLISLTVRGGVQVGEDLVGCVLRQERFVEKMNKLDWLHSPLVFKSLQEAVLRYSRFFEMLTDANLRQMLVPTLDIDLAWHTHQLTMYGYFRDCRGSPVHAVIDHDDKVDEGRLDDGFAFTAKRYKQLYKEEYSVCFCLYCTSKRSDSLRKFSQFFKTKKQTKKEEYLRQSHPLSSRGEGFSHISAHNSVRLPTELASSRREKKPAPWADNTYLLYTTPLLFVVPPIAPITEGQCDFYGNGLCTSATTLCSSIGGTCCNIAPCSGNGGAACFGAGLNPSNYGHARIGGSVVEIGGVCGADNNSTSAGCVGASGCSGGAAGNCTGGGSGF